MRMVRLSFASLPNIRAIFAGSFIALAVAASALTPTAEARVTTRPARQAAPTPFLTLPFAPSEDMRILSGWYYSGRGGFHGGIDYIKGSLNGVRGWQTFPVVASADGEACGNCTSRQGNAVWIKHNINGATYYTYYGHLSSIAKDIPLGTQSRTIWVKRGDVIGMAGDTGSRGLLHLHFALYNAASQPVDPYSIGKLREAYPQPLISAPGLGWFVKY